MKSEVARLFVYQFNVSLFWNYGLGTSKKKKNLTQIMTRAQAIG